MASVGVPNDLLLKEALPFEMDLGLLLFAQKEFTFLLQIDFRKNIFTCNYIGNVV